MKNRAEFFTEGGERNSFQERAVRAYEKFTKMALCEMVFAVEKGFEFMRRKFFNETKYAERLIKAFIANCKKPHENTYTYLSEYYKLYMSERCFYKYKRQMIDVIAVALGYIDGNFGIGEFGDDPIEKMLRDMKIAEEKCAVIQTKGVL